MPTAPPGPPGNITPGYPSPQPVLPPPQPLGPQYTINAPPAPPPQQFSNVATLITGNVCGVMLFYRPARTVPAAPNQQAPGMPGFAVQPKAALLLEGVDYTRNGGTITMTVPLFPGDTLVACVFTLGLQLGGNNPQRYVAPWSLQVAGPYDGVSRTGYSIVFGPTIMGGVDGQNNLFTLGVCNQRYQVWRNGLLQTLGTDVVTGPTAFVFMPGSIPQPGDILTALAYNNC